MAKLTITQAKAQGYAIGTTCYPHVGYVGNRFEPDEKLVMPQMDVFTETEADLLEACELVINQSERDPGWHTPGMKSAIQQVRQAIVKARGEENG